MKNKFVTGLIFITLVLFVAVFVYVRYSGTAQQPATTSIVNSPTSTLSEVVSRVTAANKSLTNPDWNMYKVKNIGLTFNYPSGLLFQDTQDGVNIFADTPENRAFIKDPSGYEGTRPGMFIKIIGSNQTAESYAKGVFPNQEYASATLFGENAIVLTGQGMDRWDIILFMHSNNLYQVSIQYGSPSDEARMNFYKILSSFIWQN